jgi:predicted phage terminase large subunit-like protein
MAETKQIRPQKGPQETFLTTPADVAFYGGSAGGGKTWALLLEILRNVCIAAFGAVIFRRTSPQITNEGGLFDESSKLYPLLGATSTQNPYRWVFPSGAKCTFAHMQYEKNRIDWQGSAIPLIGFDEVTHFTWRQFTYMLSRSRTMCGVKPYIRGTCNPDPDSWVADFIAWWIDPETGYAIDERSGVIRYFYMVNDAVCWADTAEELTERYGEIFKTPDGGIIPPKSFTFVKSSIYDNKALLAANPEYLSNLLAMPLVERERLLGGNWKIRETAGTLFRREYFPIVSKRPIDCRWARGWDLAGTEPHAGNTDPDYTAGVLMGIKPNGGYCIGHIVRGQLSPAKVETLLTETAEEDGKEVVQCFFVDPGQAGKAQRLQITRLLAGYKVSFIPVTKGSGKVQIASPVSAQAEAGNIEVVEGLWNKEFFTELEAFPESGHDDQVDGLSRAFIELTGKTRKKISGVRSISG